VKNVVISALSRAIVYMLRRKGVIGLKNARFVGLPVVSCRTGAKISIGENFVAVSWARLQVIGVNHPAILRAVHPKAEIRIGKDCGISGATIVAARSIQIGDGCLIGANAMIVDTDFHPIHALDRRYLPMPAPQPSHSIIIGKNVFIGANATILKGSTIGDNSVVGAGAVVSGKFAAHSIIAGNPARAVGVVRSTGSPTQQLIGGDS